MTHVTPLTVHPAPTTHTRPRRAESAPPAFEVVWARHHEEVRAAQRLRHEVFVGELGARLTTPAGSPPGHDIDVFDAFCEHLLVRTLPTDDSAPQVIGTYRVLTPAAARRAGGYYSETEFDLTRLRSLRPQMVELGRSCVHRDWRHGGTILALWTALGDLMARNQWHTMIGCASVGMQDGGHVAASLWRQLSRTHFASIEWQVRARLPLPIDDLRQDLQAELPPLIKGYLRCGAKLIGEPAWDPDFGTADLPLMLRMSDLSARYARRAGVTG